MATGTQNLGIGVAIGCVATLITIAFSLLLTRSCLRKGISDWARYTYKKNKNTIFHQRIYPPPTAERGYWNYNFLPDRLPPLSLQNLNSNMILSLQIPAIVFTYMEDAIEYPPLGDVPESTFDEEQMIALAGPPPEWATWSDGMAKALTRRDTARRFLAQVLVPRMHHSCEVEESLLPTDMLQCYKDLAYNTTLKKTQQGPEAYQSLWRETSYLLAAGRYGVSRHEAQANHPFEKNDPREDKVKELVAALRDALKLDVVVREELRPRLDHVLRHMVECAANIALAMFGQPDEWDYYWGLPSLPGRLVFPGIETRHFGEPRLRIKPEIEFYWYDYENNTGGPLNEVSRECIVEYDASREAKYVVSEAEYVV